MARGVFVTGTDTGVGKTVVSAALVRRYRRRGPVRYWKPIQTGIEQDDDTAEVARLAECRPEEVLVEGIRLRRPVSPHLAARMSGTTISLSPLVEMLHQTDGPWHWIVEGAGGVLVPINDRQTMADVMVAFGLPAVVTARTALGTINHTLLTLEALGHRGIEVAGVILVGPPAPGAREAIEQYGRVAILDELPRFDPLTPEALGEWVDRGWGTEDRR